MKRTIVIINVLILLFVFSNTVIAQETFWCLATIRDVASDDILENDQFHIKFTVEYSVEGIDRVVSKTEIANGPNYPNPVLIEIDIPEPQYVGMDYQVTEIRASYLPLNPYQLECAVGDCSSFGTSLMPTFYVDMVSTPNPDVDGDNIDDSEEIALAQMFSPVLVKTVTGDPNTTEKQGGLAKVEDFIASSHLYYHGSLVTTTPWTSTLQYDGHVWHPAGYCSHAIPGVDIWGKTKENELRGQNPGLYYLGASSPNIPLYYHVYKEGNYYYVQYWMWFNFNDIRDQTMQETWHEGDWEHISIKISKNGSSYTPVAINLYQHEGGHTKTNLSSEGKWSSTGNYPSNVKIGYDTNHKHPVIYVASNAHACYFYNDLRYKVVVTMWPGAPVTAESYVDVVDYSVNLNGTLWQDYHIFNWNNLIKLGESREIWDSRWHGGIWYEVHYYSTDKKWNAFMGRMGAYKVIVDYIIDKLATKSPFPPYHGNISHEYYDFSINSTTSGFGNHNKTTPLPVLTTSVISWIQ